MADAKDKTTKPHAGASGSGSHSHDADSASGQQAVVLSDSIRLGKEADPLLKLSLGIGVVGLVLSLVLGGGLTGKQFQHSYLTAYMWGMSIAAGGLFWVTLQHIMNARWSIVVRRLGEIISQGVVVMALLTLPLLIPLFTGSDALYSWANTEFMEADHALHSKMPYLNVTFFSIRVVGYFAFWILFSRYLLKQSIRQEDKKDAGLEKRLQARSAPGMIAFALTVTFFSFDLLMSLDPIWFSTIFGVYYFSTCVLTFMASLGLFSMWLQKKGHLTTAVTREHYHDIGKMLFAFTAFWTYTAFSQFMLIWYANIPEETHWFHDRLQGSWFNATLILITIHFVIPFFGLMSRQIKRNKKTLAFWSVWILGVCWFDLHWLIAPNLHKGGLSLHLADFTAWIGVAGILLAFVLFRAKSVNLIALGDSRLKRSLAFENL